MKKVKLLLTMAVIVFSTMICCSMSAFALTDGDWEFDLLDNEVRITGYIGTDAEIVIPNTIYGCPVTSTKAYGIFSKEAKKAITSVTIPSTIKKIEDATFESCEKLEKVDLPEGLEHIGKYAFRGCSSLENVHLPETIKTIGGEAFDYCTSLKFINFPAGLESIESGWAGETFWNTALESIDLSQTDAKLGQAVFRGCKKLKTAKIHPDATGLTKWMFYQCESLENIEIPASVQDIGDLAFGDCKSLKSIVLPISLKRIGGSAFEGCVGLEEIVIPYGTTQIDGYAFRYCENLRAVYIPDTVTKFPLLNPVEGCPNAIVYCGDGSKAADYCKKNNISYLTDSSVNSGIHVYYNGKRISFHSYAQNPEILDGRTLVPLRSIFEAMGADVEWDGATSTAIAKRGNVEVKITIGASEIYKNGKAIPVDVPAMLLNSRTMVPARVIAEAFGADVDWNGNGRVVLITE